LKSRVENIQAEHADAQHPTGIVAVVIRFLATGFGIGRIRSAPGTWGTLWGCVIAWALYEVQAGWFGWIATLVIAQVLGLLISYIYEQYFHTKDPGELVVDEIAAFPITMLPVTAFSWPAIIAGFIAFRIFDISKPPPIKRLEKLPGAFGVMTDDLLAAGYAALCMWWLTWTHWI
jgi:phosphatidylglycerophosphatase A